jgi:tetrahydromethanopterin S-methyltransferase subunit G
MIEGYGQFDQLVDRIDRAFAGIDAALIEQRQYTEFAYERLDAKIDAGFAWIHSRLDGIDGRLDGVDGRFAQIDGRLDGIDGRLDRIERKLDGFIEVQRQTNQLMDRRLRLLESR